MMIESDDDEGIPLTNVDEFSARMLGRLVLAHGVDSDDEPEYVMGNQTVYTTCFKLTHLHRQYSTTLLPFGNMLRCNISSDDWKAALWVEPPFGTSRSLVDLNGKEIMEFFRYEHFPFFEVMAEKIRKCRNGLTEADHVVFGFWMLTFGKLSPHPERMSAFLGDHEAFERDMLMLKMDEGLTDLFKVIDSYD